jgi:hypothetical protein
VDSVLWRGEDTLDAAEALSEQIRELPESALPLIVAGGSFNSDRHETRMQPGGREVIDALLRGADPEKVFFVIGHRLTAHERYLVENNRGRFQIYAIVPAALRPAELARLRTSGASVRASIEPSGNGVYKSFAYEIFKRRSSLLLAFDGNSPAANLVQEAKNSPGRCTILADGASRALRAKARSLQGYVRCLDELDDPVAEILKHIE